MRALLDGDIFSYEIGFGAETGWKDKGEIPPFAYVETLLLNRIDEILRVTGADSYQIYLSGDRNFRTEIAKTKPYKGTRKPAKPFHYKNLRAYMEGVLNAIITDGIEADDAMAIEQTLCGEDTIICSRDKDLKQVKGWHYGWEIGKQPQYGPELVDEIGYLELMPQSNKLMGCGHKFFFAQCIMGDVVDNIPGIPKAGPLKAFNLLSDINTYDELLEAVRGAYRDYYGDCGDINLLEQGQLLWMVRELDEKREPVMWSFDV